jgi:hypothetical protein
MVVIRLSGKKQQMADKGAEKRGQNVRPGCQKAKPEYDGGKIISQLEGS